MSITANKKPAWLVALQWTASLAFLGAFAAAMGFEQFIRTLLLGLPQGSIIALIAVGYSMVYGIILLINFAHGEVFMLSAYLALTFLWLPSRFPIRVPGFAMFIPLVVAVLLVGTTFVTVNTFGATTVGLRRREWRWAVAAVGGAAVGFLAYRSFLAYAWLSVFAALVLAGAAFFVTRVALGARDWPLNAPRPRLAVSCAAAAGVGAAFYWLLGGNLLLAATVASAGLTATIGVTLDSVAYKPLRTAPRLIPLITAIGMSIFFQSLAQVIWGAEPFVFDDEVLPGVLRPPQTMTEDGEWITNEYLAEQSLADQVRMGHAIMITGLGFYAFDEPIRVPIVDLVIVGLGLVVMLGLHLLIHRTRLGKSMRACSEDKTTARLVGVNVDAVVAATFVIGSMMAALVSPLWVIKYAAIEPTMGLIVGVLAFASAVLGGIGDVKGAMIGGLAIGLIYNFVPAFENIDTWAMVNEWHLVSEDTAFWIYDNILEGLTQWRVGVAYAFMILVLIVKPTGLFGETTAKRA